MIRFIVFGRGRSGTTVVTDELRRHPQIAIPMEGLAHGEYRWDLTEPFAQWPPIAVDTLPADIDEAAAPLPYDHWCQLHGIETSSGGFSAYLDRLETWGAAQDGVRAVGFKIIDSQLKERPALLEELGRRGYRVVNLHRRNIVRHALSGLLAQQRGVFNARDYDVPQDTYDVDLQAYVWELQSIVKWVQHWDGEIARLGMPAVTAEYEQFLTDRELFYRPILALLEVDLVVPATSNFTRMTPKDLSHTIRNYDQIVDFTQRIGLEHLLTEY